MTYRSCYDGDTCRFDIPNVHPFFGENIPVRLAGIDAPDLQGKCDQEKQLAVKARDLVQTTLEQAHSITLKNVERGANIFGLWLPWKPMVRMWQTY